MVIDVYDNSTKLCHYKIKYEDVVHEHILNEHGEIETVNRPVTITEYCVSNEGKDEFIEFLGDREYTITPMSKGMIRG